MDGIQRDRLVKQTEDAKKELARTVSWGLCPDDLITMYAKVAAISLATIAEVLVDKYVKTEN